MAQVEPHTNLVSIVGVITRGCPKARVLSYCEHGGMPVLLRSGRFKAVLAWSELEVQQCVCGCEQSSIPVFPVAVVTMQGPKQVSRTSTGRRTNK